MLERDYSPLTGVDGHVLPALSLEHLADSLQSVVGDAHNGKPRVAVKRFRFDAESVGRRRGQSLRVNYREAALFSHVPNNTASYVPATVYASLGLTTVPAAELFAKCNSQLQNANTFLMAQQAYEDISGSPRREENHK